MSSMNRGIYSRPLFVVVRLEALWTVNIAYARFVNKCLRHFVETIPKLPQRGYKPAYSNQGGYEARLFSLSIENSLASPEVESPYPDW